MIVKVKLKDWILLEMNIWYVVWLYLGRAEFSLSCSIDDLDLFVDDVRVERPGEWEDD